MRNARFRKSVLLLFGLVLAASCSTRGRPFPTDQINDIEVGRTTAAEIKEWFGKPTSIHVSARGGSEWSYEHQQGHVADTGTASRIGGTLSSVFGGPSVRPPVNVAYGNEVWHRLILSFDANGVVDDYEYDRTDQPTRRVY